MKKIFLFIMIALLFACTTTKADKKTNSINPEGISYQGQKLFLSGMNLAWINFSRDLTQFNEDEFIRALNEIATAGGNAVRWWIHVNGSSTPSWEGESPYVSGMPDGSLKNLKRALDLSRERGIGVVLCLWSFDMLQEQSQMNPERNKAFLETPDAVDSYLKNALTPMVETVGGHPGIIAWEVFNEPEGMDEKRGWTPVRTDMKTIQGFVNKVAGTIHRISPESLVTNGTKDISTNSDINHFSNYYRDDRLIEAGGDPEGILDFYQVHFYQAHMGDEYSLFHNPASHWELDKPILIGEFSACGIIDYGRGIKTSSSLSPEEAYTYAFENGYAGALAWTWTAHEPEFGSTNSAAPGMMKLKFTYPEYTKIDTSLIDKIPVKTGKIERLLVFIGEEKIENYVDLKTVFSDPEEGTELKYSISSNTSRSLATPEINGSQLSIKLNPQLSGAATLTIKAEDSSGNSCETNMELVVVDPDKGNIALFKQGKASSIENESHPLEHVNDGMLSTRHSTLYENDQWIELDLDGSFIINKTILHWEAAHGREYSFQVSADGENWTEVFTETDGKAEIITYEFEKTEASYVRLKLDKRGTEWGFSLWEWEIWGERK